jgi:hypothetical protein
MMPRPTPQRHPRHVETYRGLLRDLKPGFLCGDRLAQAISETKTTYNRWKFRFKGSEYLFFSTQKSSVSLSWNHKSSNSAFLAASARQCEISAMVGLVSRYVHDENTRPRRSSDSSEWYRYPHIMQVSRYNHTWFFFDLSPVDTRVSLIPQRGELYMTSTQEKVSPCT